MAPTQPSTKSAKTARRSGTSGATQSKAGPAKRATRPGAATLRRGDAAQAARPLKLAVPNKGRLSDDALRILQRAGIHLRGSSDRRLWASALDGRLQVLFLRANDIPAFVADGTVDAGITGLDAVREADADVVERLDLGFGACRLVVAVPEDDAARRPADLGAGVRIATSYPRLTRDFFARTGRDVHVVTVSGACEIAPTLGIADAITDITSTGSTLAMNHLRAIGTVLESTCWLVTTPNTDDAVAEELERLVFALGSVVAARDKRYLLADVPRAALDEIRVFLPGLAGPTVVEIAGDPDTVAIQVVVDERDVFDAVHRLKRLGGRGILVIPIDRLVD
jgi:ATP phosphoribosyltransferase